MKNRLGILLLVPSLLVCSCTGNGPQPEVITLKEFTGVKFEDKHFNYDGKQHSIEVTGAPEDTIISYINNDKVEVGKYEVTANLTKEGYNPLSLKAYLYIDEVIKEFEGLSFEDMTIDYDGKPHSLVVTGAPEDATIFYSEENLIDVGTYRINAIVSKTGYKTQKLTATLTIKGKTFTGITFSNQTFRYDGHSHSIYVSNVPEGAKVTYSGNGQVAKGTYKVTAVITAPGYERLILTATMTISELGQFPNCNFDDFYLIYDNKDIAVKNYFSSYEEKLTDNFRISYDVTYQVNGVASEEPIIKDVGTYAITATYSAEKYESRTFSFNVTISDTIGGVDSTKTAFTFTEDTKFQDLYAEIKKANYSVKRRYYDEYDYDKDGTFETIKDSPFESNYFVTPEAFAGRHNEDSTQYSTKDYFISKGTDYAFNYYYNYYSLSRLKFPVSNYLENVIYISGGMLPFTLLKESDDGGFENSQIGGYHDSYGSFVIDTENNQLIITSRCYYQHTEFNHNEVNEYIFYNIGNTTVSIPDEMKGDDSNQNLFTTDMFIENGVSYTSYETEDGKIAFCADVTLNECDDAYLGGTVCVLRAEIDGAPVSQINYNYYYNKFYVDHSKYQINVYYDNDGFYQGIYEGLGKVKYYLDARIYGAIRYYGEWDF